MKWAQEFIEAAPYLVATERFIFFIQGGGFLAEVGICDGYAGQDWSDGGRGKSGASEAVEGALRAQRSPPSRQASTNRKDAVVPLGGLHYNCSVAFPNCVDAAPDLKGHHAIG